MSILEILALASLGISAVAVLRFVWLDSLRFAEANDEVISAPTAARLKLHEDASRVLADTHDLPRAA